MREIDARVTGFDYTTFHAYTTEVEVDGRVWTLAIRYNAFYQFYTRLTALEKHFNVDFPPKGGLFFSPPPEERQEQLDDFLLSTLAYFDMRGHPKRMEALLGELLQIPEHLDLKDDEERTASEGSSVAEELLLDTPMPGHNDNDDDFLESGHESDDHEEGHSERDNQVDVARKVKSEQEAPAVQENDVELEMKPEAVEAEAELEEKAPIVQAETKEAPKAESDEAMPAKHDKELTGGSVAKSYIAMLRRQTLVNGAIQAAVVSTMKENVEKAKAAKEEQAHAEEVEQLSDDKEEEVKAVKVLETAEKEERVEAKEEDIKPVVTVETQEQQEIAIPELEEKPAAPVQDEPAETLVAVSEVVESVSIAPLEEAVEPVVVSADASVTKPEQDVDTQDPALASAIKTEAPAQAESVEDEEDAASESTKTEAESENPVMSWFHRMGTFGPSAVEKEEQEQEAAAAAKKDQEEKEAAARAEAEVTAKAEAEAAAAHAHAEAEALEKAKAEAAEAELLHAEQELNLRLQRYRHPVFFQRFNCDVGTSRYSLPQRLSDGIIV
ncbi:hypothetical protein PF008_g17995 [Phytophthora fragariae]|uniref:PX domain-containing protein n=1 Tax=Phytophthora fragariae TaxID=53985 RepID=A0A6G0R6L8_9STRA|nr:hypothetical protein PF008_g17995 [Phytophthora fragariae]